MTTTPALRRPALADAPLDGPGALVALDPVQQEAVAWARAVGATARSGAPTASPALLVLGAPGSGRTTVALEAAAAAVQAGLDPTGLLVLAASRRGAADLRDRLAARLPLTSGRPLVQTPAAAAFAVLRTRAVALGEPVPTLVSGPEQDLLLAELLAGHAAGDGARVDWPERVRAEALGVRAFRDELRDLLMRAAERGLTPADLADLGDRHGRPEWSAAARVYAEYLDVLDLRAGTPDAGLRLDPAVVVSEAVRVLEQWEAELPGTPAPRWRLVVVDDHQESTSATARLLSVLAARGARTLLTADPDAAVQTFRGAEPALVARASDPPGPDGALGATRLVLPAVWRHGAHVRAAVARVTERIGTVGAAAHRRAPSAATGGRGQTGADRVRVAVLPSGAQEAAFVARELRRAYLEDHVPWHRMAVVARAGSHVTALRRALGSAQVPVTVLGSDVPLRDEPAVRPLLDAMAVAVGAAELDAAVAARLACSPLGGLDPVGLRRVRRALRAEELAGGGGRTSDALLVEALDEPGRAATLAPAVASAVDRLARVVAAGRTAAARPGADAQGVLWALWDAAGLAEPWRRAALVGGAAGERADRDLDAVLALFRAAETFVDRMPRTAPAVFVEWLRSQDLPADSLAAQARRDAVAVLTPAGAAGGEWDVVAVAGVQEGVWPDLRLRDSLLGAQTLVEVVSGRRSATAGDDAAQARAAVLSDELRSFAVALSRARRLVVVTAVADADHQPSPFVDLVEPPVGERDQRLTHVEPALDLRGLVAQLRAELEGAAARGAAPDAGALRALGELAALGIPGADPATWHGLVDVSTDAPLYGPGELVPVSPSKLETAHRCALRWALEAAGGTSGSSGGQSLGTLVHAIAQEHPHGTHAELAAALDARWAELGLGTGWPARATRARADEMVRRLADYLAGAGEALLVEGEFRLRTDRALVRGAVDRIERDLEHPDQVRVVDLKTGASPPSKEQALTNPQLGAYQLAVDGGAFADLPPGTTSAGAQLVYLGTGASAAVRDQPRLGGAEGERTWAAELVDDVADRMAASAFTATANDQCDRCPVRRSCPVRAEGGQVVA
ncbi:ATP-dependent helicase [Cellulomonas gilvus]|uniref:DNA 3'-5' helicase n=1 Tax=Cellulomonas gilvus (strain ATCC 13127 / NRRL B-14078) TaxID=593907 RepID=F8A0E7_CELGA|nr:UrvD/REP family ATP-dependent DNA helicase [Cellulomonas gilvus]AEI11491.1 UvrD/REP helicase [Cellulomonas gilvus ATCC 13127]